MLRALRLATVLLCAVMPVFRVQAGASDEADTAAARELFGLVNEVRSQDGRAALEWDDRLAEAALGHAKLLVQHKQLSHQFAGELPLNLRLAKTSLRLDRSGENLALDSSVPGAHEALLHSPPHRANILSPDYNAIGIAVVRAGGTLYVVQDFAHRLAEQSVGQFEDQIAAEFDRVRRSAGAEPLRRVDVSYLRREACDMARGDSVDREIKAPGARFVVMFTASQPKSLPADVTRFRSNNQVESYGLGACFERSRTYPSGVYWVVMALFPKSTQTRRVN